MYDIHIILLMCVCCNDDDNNDCGDDYVDDNNNIDVGTGSGMYAVGRYVLSVKYN